MLERVEQSGVMLFRSPLLARAGVVHAFSTRVGGVSQNAFASLNLGQPSNIPQQDDPDHVAENWRRFQSAVGVAELPRISIKQVHGNVVIDATSHLDSATCGDALLSTAIGQLLTIRVADCVPILLATNDGSQVAAIHAGWRGVVLNIVKQAVERMKSSSIVAAIGPCIGTNAFEVGDEVAKEFRNADLKECVVHHAKPHIDLVRAVELQLNRLAITHVDTPGVCTFDRPDLFFSHRRDQGLTGRMAAVILS
jgi:polyphenol oxidase